MVRRNRLLDSTKKWKPIWYEEMEAAMADPIDRVD